MSTEGPFLECREGVLQFIFLVLNGVFFVYLGIPVAAHLLVSGAGRAFRGVLA